MLAVGPGRVTDDGKLQPIEVKVGDTVVFGKYAGTEVKVGGMTFDHSGRRCSGCSGKLVAPTRRGTLCQQADSLQRGLLVPSCVASINWPKR